MVPTMHKALVPLTGYGAPTGVREALYRVRAAGLVDFEPKARRTGYGYDLTPLIRMLAAAERPADDPVVDPELRERLRVNREWKAEVIERATQRDQMPEEMRPWVKERTVRVVIV